ncbi:MAG: hypothetical protein AB7O73_09825 [Bacteroidia bacterium]
MRTTFFSILFLSFVFFSFFNSICALKNLATKATVILYEEISEEDASNEKESENEKEKEKEESDVLDFVFLIRNQITSAVSHYFYCKNVSLPSPLSVPEIDPPELK